VAGWLFSPGTIVSSTNKTDHCDNNRVLLKVVLNTNYLTLLGYPLFCRLTQSD